IRDFHVTGVQTCALPIFGHGAEHGRRRRERVLVGRELVRGAARGWTLARDVGRQGVDVLAEAERWCHAVMIPPRPRCSACDDVRSEERRVGKEWRSGGWA